MQFVCGVASFSISYPHLLPTSPTHTSYPHLLPTSSTHPHLLPTPPTHAHRRFGLARRRSRPATTLCGAPRVCPCVPPRVRYITETLRGGRSRRRDPYSCDTSLCELTLFESLMHRPGATRPHQGDPSSGSCQDARASVGLGRSHAQPKFALICSMRTDAFVSNLWRVRSGGRQCDQWRIANCRRGVTVGLARLHPAPCTSS